MKLLGLTLNEEKTKIVSLWEGKQGFDFLGFHNRKIKCITKNKRSYYTLTQWISRKSVKKIKEKAKAPLSRSSLNQDLRSRIEIMNRKIVGWRNYFGISRKDKLIKLDRYINFRMIIWINSKRKKRKRYKYEEESERLRLMGLKSLIYST